MTTFIFFLKILFIPLVVIFNKMKKYKNKFLEFLFSDIKNKKVQKWGEYFYENSVTILRIVIIIAFVFSYIDAIFIEKKIKLSTDYSIGCVIWLIIFYFLAIPLSKFLRWIHKIRRG